MSNYSIALFLHIVGALGVSVALGLEWIGLSQVRRALVLEEIRAILGTVKRADRLGFVSMLTAVITGIYMLLTVWGWVPWMLVVLGAFVLGFVLVVAFTKPRMAAIEQALATEKGSVSQTFHNLVNHPILWISIQTRAAIILGMVFLKIAKPDLDGSLFTIGVATVLGLASALPVLRPVRIFVTFFITAFVAALVLLAANSIPASTIPLSKTTSDVQSVQTKRSEIPIEVGSSNLSMQAPTPSSETALQEGLSILQTRCTQCHPLQKILQVKKTRTEWEETLSRMESFDVKISDMEKKVLLDYLTIVDKP